MKSFTPSAMDNIADVIKESISMEDVLIHYGFRTAHNGRIPCPIHNGKDNNFSYKKHHFKCFVCGAGGSVIDFVMELFGIGFREACLRLNEEFHLGLSDRKPSRAEVSALLRARQEAEARREREAEEYRQMAEEHRYWWEVLKCFDFPHPLWCEAVKRRPYLEDWLDEHLGAGRL